MSGRKKIEQIEVIDFEVIDFPRLDKMSLPSDVLVLL